MISPRTPFDDSFVQRLPRGQLRDLGALARRLFDLPPSRSAEYDPAQLADVDASRLQAISSAVRGEEYRPAIFVHGVMPRSGTNYVADLVKLHSAIAPYPHQLWEFPLLHVVDSISAAQTAFLRTYKGNMDVIKSFEFLAYLASGLLSYLQHLAGPEKTILLKVPHAEYLYLFHAVFPRDHCVLVLRDGRDAVASHLKTFGYSPLKPRTSELSDKWARSAQAVLGYTQYRVSSSGQSLVVRYENAHKNPVETVQTILQTCGLAEDSYHFQGIPALPVRGSSATPDAVGVNWRPKEKPADFQPVGRWHGWSRAEKRRFKRYAGAALVAAGYAADDSW